MGGRERDRGSYGGGGGGRGGGNFRGRGGGYKPRRYWDNDEYYKDDRERGGRRRRRSYSRSRSRSYSSRSRSRSPPPRRGGRSRSRSPPPQSHEEYIPRPAEHNISATYDQVPEPYVPSNDPANSWTGSSLTVPLTHANGQAINQMNSYPDPYRPPRYQEHQGPLTAVNQAAMSYGYGQSVAPVTQYPQQAAPPGLGYPQPPGIALAPSIPPPPVISEPKTIQEGNESSKKSKKEKRKKKKRHHSSSSSSSSSEDDSSSESRRRSKSKRDQGNSDSSSEDEKKESAPSKSVLTNQQREALTKQREGYRAKLEILEREIGKLRSKEDELIRSRADRQLIDENLKLQAELKGRCKAVLIVLEKIDDVFKDKDGSKSSPAIHEKPKPAVPARAVTPPVVPPPLVQKHVQSSLEPKGFSNDGSKTGITAFEYVDNRQHWCRLCNVFPETVEDMLAHFHSKEHHDQIQQLGIDEKPWHKRNTGSDSKHVPGAKKAPFRGMQFFSPVQGWYCRLCNSWMGDPHCAVEHLKSDEHNSNYMNFLEEHPDWERKWVSDREKALGASGTQEIVSQTNRKSRFDDERQSDRPDKKPSVHEDMESGKSIRVQMRNSLKGEEKLPGPGSQYAPPPAVIETKANKDSGLDEWMNKPKVPVDIIDTQKFAAIVRQKHGGKEKEHREREAKADALEVKLVPSAPVISSAKDGRDSRRERDDRRRTDKVELQISSRDKDRDRDIRDRYRERDSRSSRRRSRSRSRSRSRDRRYNRRRSRSRSRSRSRERSDRDRRDNRERERPEVKEAVKKLPMIGKMPLYKRPVFTKEKVEVGENKNSTVDVTPAAVPPSDFIQKDIFVHQKDESRVSMFSDNSLSNPPINYETNIAAYAQDNTSVGEYGSVAVLSQYASLHNEAVPEESSDMLLEGADHTLTGSEEKEKDEAPTALPDDFQQALDIIYSVNTGGNLPKSTTVPQPVPPPLNNETGSSTNAVNDESDPPAPGVSEYGTDYGTNGYGTAYMGYHVPYHQSFDGYAPYEELDDGPPGVGDDPPPGTMGHTKPPPTMVESSQQQQVKRDGKDPAPPGDDDMDDLRMLGIDVDDTAVVKH